MEHIGGISLVPPSQSPVRSSNTAKQRMGPPHSEDLSMRGIGVLDQPVTPDWEVFNTRDKPSYGVVWTRVTGGNRCPGRYCDGPGALIEKVVGVSVQKVPNYMAAWSWLNTIVRVDPGVLRVCGLCSSLTPWSRCGLICSQTWTFSRFFCGDDRSCFIL